jgi:hypothetical protein
LALHKVDEREMSALVWGRKVNWFIFDLMLAMWRKRNEEGYYSSSQKDSALTRERLLQRIAALQQSNPDIGYHHRDFIYCDPTVFQSYSNNNLRCWLNASESLKKMYKNAIDNDQQLTSRIFGFPTQMTREWSNSTSQFICVMQNL